MAGSIVARALARKRDRGERLGAVPLGYRNVFGADGRVSVEMVAEEMETVRLAREMRAAGLSLRRIASAFAEAGRPTKRGGRWAAATVRKLLAPRYLETVVPGSSGDRGAEQTAAVHGMDADASAVTHGLGGDASATVHGRCGDASASEMAQGGAEWMDEGGRACPPS